MTSHERPRARAIAFYLPQFHPIPENDAWWGKGFTEWTNVSRARPLFPGHHQPRLPTDLGFYDLRLPQILEAQADLARSHGIYGFCYHYYFFKDGKRLLEQPVEQMLRSGKPDFPFCLCWANENWTRRWDGLDSEILQAQEHSAANDRAFMQSLLPYFRDPRYIRIDGRPVVIIYRASLFPNFADTVRRWHAQLQEEGEAPPYVVVAESYDLRGDIVAGANIDATCEFPPHGQFSRALGDFPVRFFAPFSGSLYDYERVVDHFLERPVPELRRFKTVTLGWDNTARKKSSAVIMGNFSLAAYHRWLTGAIDYTKRNAAESEQYVFINAWNEWAEGTYLEPDQLLGHAYLETTRAALFGRAFDRRLLTRTTGPTAARRTAPQASESTGIALDHEPGRSPAYRCAGKVSGLAVAGEDSDLVEAFVRENLRLLDRLVVCVHRDQKKVLSILESLVGEGLPLSIRTRSALRSSHRDVLNEALRDVAENPALEWIVPLETNEFLDAADRSEFWSVLDASASQHGRIPSITYASTAFDDAREPHPLRRMRHRYAHPVSDSKPNQRNSKIVVNCALLRRFLDRYELDGGAHSIVFRGTNDAVLSPVGILPGVVLRQFPVRSMTAGIETDMAMPDQESVMSAGAVGPADGDQFGTSDVIYERGPGSTLIVDPFQVSAELRYSR